MESLQTFEITARDDGQKLVELKFEGVTIDRYTTHDLSKHPKRRCGWISNVVQLCSQDSDPTTEFPFTGALPGFSPNGVYDQLERTERELADLQKACTFTPITFGIDIGLTEPSIYSGIEGFDSKYKIDDPLPNLGNQIEG